MARKYTLKYIEEQIGGIYDLKLTHGSYGSAYTAKKKNVATSENARRVFVAWDYDQLTRDNHIGETATD